MTYKQKNGLLLVGFIILLWIAYQLSFSNAIAQKKQYITLKNELSMVENSSLKLKQLQKQLQYYDSILEVKNIRTSTSFQNNVLNIINSIADTTNLSVLDFKTPHFYVQDNFEIQTYPIILNGGFNQSLKLIYQLEQISNVGNIVSASFEKKKNYGKNVYFLETTILLQHIKQK
jgi:hypothetical protein